MPHKKYVWTPERDQVMRDRYDSKIHWRAEEIAKSFCWPKWVIKKRAMALGLAHPMSHQDWTKEETNFLLDHAGDKTALWIAKQLERSETSVVLKFKRLHISRRVHVGYTLRDLEMCFGTDHHVIERWVREDKLHVRRRHTARPLQIWKATDEDILRFIIEHPMDFRLDKCDQVWFMDLITSGGLLRKALKTAKNPEDSDGEEAA